MAGRSNLERNAITGVWVTVSLTGDGNRVLDNRLVPLRLRGVRILGDGNVVANNVMDVTRADEAAMGSIVEGDYNVLRSNTVLAGVDMRTLAPLGNQRHGEHARRQHRGAAPTPTERARVGMWFTADGNYYGDNRMAAEVPFELGGTVQTDWGGNVDY